MTVLKLEDLLIVSGGSSSCQPAPQKCSTPPAPPAPPAPVSSSCRSGCCS